MADRTRYWAVVPAAGVGARMEVELPKQYLTLAGTTVLQRSLDTLLAFEPLEKIVVALSRDDRRWPSLPAAGDSRVATVAGGAERCDSVLAGLRGLAEQAAPGDWVLVHDAARPCLRPADLELLVTELADDPIGGLLALQVAETVKRADAEARVLETVPRADLWLAQTPQLFRYGVLRDALEAAVGKPGVTDEAAAVELAGHRPRLVPGSATNIKITRPADLVLAEHFLAMGEL